MFDLKELREKAPWGFMLLEGVVYYSGEKPKDTRLNTILVKDKQLITEKYLEEKRYAFVIGYLNAKDTNQFVYVANEYKLENIYRVMRKIYDGWYKGDTLLGLDEILNDDSKEFVFDKEDFASFKDSLCDIDILADIRKNNPKTIGEIFALAYVDFLKENYETKSKFDRGQARIMHKKLYGTINRFKKAYPINPASSI